MVLEPLSMSLCCGYYFTLLIFTIVSNITISYD